MSGVDGYKGKILPQNGSGDLIRLLDKISIGGGVYIQLFRITTDKDEFLNVEGIVIT